MPLKYRDRGTTGTQEDVLTGDLPIGVIRRASDIGGDAVYWSWNLSVLSAPPDFQPHGRAVSFEDAKADLERNWQLWLEAAALTDK
jgi:hypothetical protein